MPCINPLAISALLSNWRCPFSPGSSTSPAGSHKIQRLPKTWSRRLTFLTSRTGLAAVSTVSFDADDASAEPSTHETPESVLLARFEQHAIQNALAELPVNFREVILLCDMEEMTYQEIAQTLSIPMGTVMSRLSRARKAMRSTLLSARRETASL